MKHVSFVTFAIAATAAMALVSGCARKVNDPADVRAIRDASAAWDKAWNAADCDALASLYAPDAIAMGPNEPTREGRDAIRVSCERFFEQFREKNHSRVDDVLVSGDLAVARGTQVDTTSPKAGGRSTQDKDKWISAFRRQPDGSWKILWEMYNSDLPVSDTLPVSGTLPRGP